LLISGEFYQVRFMSVSCLVNPWNRSIEVFLSELVIKFIPNLHLGDKGPVNIYSPGRRPLTTPESVDLEGAFKGLSYEIDFENVDEF
jgi:hypothetical protein